MKIKTTAGVTRLLLHTCCAPCSTAIAETLIKNGIQPTLFYYNPNIFPQEEYEKRKAEAVRYALSLGIEFVNAEYDHSKWLIEMQGHENEPERGLRCLECFRHRLAVAAKYAKENGYKVFATTLASSRWKNLEQINRAGDFAASMFKGITFLAHNWRKNGLSERRNELVRQYGFYNQQYCGCEFSMRK